MGGDSHLIDFHTCIDDTPALPLIEAYQSEKGCHTKLF